MQLLEYGKVHDPTEYGNTNLLRGPFVRRQQQGALALLHLLVSERAVLALHKESTREKISCSRFTVTREAHNSDRWPYAVDELIPFIELFIATAKISARALRKTAAAAQRRRDLALAGHP